MTYREARAVQEKPASRRQLDRFSEIKQYYAIHNLLRLHPEVTYWILHWDRGQGLRWMELGEEAGRIEPYHFETYYGREADRDAYYLRVMREAARKQKPVVSSLFGFSDFFCPIASDEEGESFLYAGQFFLEPPHWSDLAECWQELTGAAAASANPDFARFVRMALRLPVVDPPLLECMEAFAELYAVFVTGQRRDPRWYERVERLRREIPRRHISSEWVARAVDPDKFLVTPWHYEGELPDWMKEEWGICRLPTTALTLMPVSATSEPVDPLRALVRNAKIQRECMRFARDLPETAAGKLQDYGVLFLTSANPGRSRVRQRLELRERAEYVRGFVRKRSGVDSVVGLGRAVPPGESLYPSYHEAVLALHLCIQLERSCLFYDETEAPHRVSEFGSVHEAATNLLGAFDRMSAEEVEVASDQYVRAVLIYSGGRVEAVRNYFMTVLFQLIAATQKRHLLSSQVTGEFARELSRRLEESLTTYELIESFREATGRLSVVAFGPLEGSTNVRLAWVLKYLEANFAEPLTPAMVARRAGFSLSVFSRVFKEATGTPFSTHLRFMRVEHAKFLLRTTRLSSEQVAQNSGFRSSHHLIRSFKIVTGQTPHEYRNSASRPPPRG